ncbi:hypothetical protein BGZ52_010988, partial [Haplosporangium bisporale]
TLAMDDFEDDDNEEDSGFAKVIPYTTHAANGASPLDVEMEESFDSSVANTDSGFDGELSDVNITEDEDMDLDEPRNHKDGLTNGSTREASELSEDRSGFPPLSRSNGTISSFVPPSSTLSYAALVKNSADESKGFFVNNNTSSMTSFSQVNIPEPRPPKASSSPTVTVVAAAGTGQYTPSSSATSSPAPSPSPQHPKERTPEEEVLRVLSAKLSGGTKKLSQLNNLPPSLSLAGLERVKDLGNHSGPVGLLSPGVPPIS